MRKLDVQAKLECAASGVAVLRGLKSAGQTMTYGQFAKAIGLMAGDAKWEPWHQSQLNSVLYLMSAAEGQRPGSDRLDFARLVNQRGEHGQGLGRKARVVKQKPDGKVRKKP